MNDKPELHHPWLVAAWPGMGHVALSAGYYLIAKLNMHVLTEFSPSDFFDIEQVEVKNGLLRTASPPRNRVFVWNDPRQKRDLIVFLGEAQPPRGKYQFCTRLIDFSRELGVEKVFTFAAMATQMHPEHESRIFTAATSTAMLEELQHLDLELVQDGNISGLNGLLLGAAADVGLQGACLLGEMPHIFAQLPFPKASLAVLETFTSLAGLSIDLAELAEQARAIDDQLGELLAKVEHETPASERLEEETVEASESPTLSPQDARRIEQLFEQSKSDRSKAYELKRELDRLQVFNNYEERFLDLFKTPET